MFTVSFIFFSIIYGIAKKPEKKKKKGKKKKK